MHGGILNQTLCSTETSILIARTLIRYQKPSGGVPAKQSVKIYLLELPCQSTDPCNSSYDPLKAAWLKARPIMSPTCIAFDHWLFNRKTKRPIHDLLHSYISMIVLQLDRAFNQLVKKFDRLDLSNKHGGGEVYSCLPKVFASTFLCGVLVWTPLKTYTISPETVFFNFTG